MQIRPATPDDVPQVLPMVRKICDLHRAWDPAKYSFIEGIEARYDGWLRKRAVDPRSVFLVAEREGRGLIAFLIATAEAEIPIYLLKEFGFIHDLWVEPDYRNEGIARQLVMLAIETFRNMGMQQIRLDTAKANEAARKLFESCGFRVSVIEMLWEG